MLPVAQKEYGVTVKLREAVNVIRSWPPVWLSVGRDRKIERGEIGVLVNAYSRREPESAIFLETRRCKQKFTGVIFLKDCAWRTQLLSMLQANIGRPMREIGDLEV